MARLSVQSQNKVTLKCKIELLSQNCDFIAFARIYHTTLAPIPHSI